MKVCYSCQNSFQSLSWVCPRCAKQPPLTDGFPTFAPALADDNDGFPKVAFDQLFKLESDNFWFRARNCLITWAILKYFPRASSFLEIGCGTGFVLHGINQAIPNLTLYGSEIYARGLQYAQRRLPAVRFIQMDARNAPFESEFDLIGAFDVLEHIQEDDVVLRQIRKSLRPGGGLILTVPQHKFLWSDLDVFACHCRRYESKELEIFLEDAGFSVLRITSFVSLLLPVLFLSRLFRSTGQAESLDLVAELTMPKILNQILEFAMMVERFTIKNGWSYPCGGSLLVIAQAK